MSLSQSRKEPAAVMWQAESGREGSQNGVLTACPRGAGLWWERVVSQTQCRLHEGPSAVERRAEGAQCGLRELDLCLGGLLLKVVPEAGGSWKGVAGVRGPEAHGGLPARLACLVVAVVPLSHALSVEAAIMWPLLALSSLSPQHSLAFPLAMLLCVRPALQDGKAEFQP